MAGEGVRPLDADRQEAAEEPEGVGGEGPMGDDGGVGNQERRGEQRNPGGGLKPMLCVLLDEMVHAETQSIRTARITSAGWFGGKWMGHLQLNRFPVSEGQYKNVL